MYESFTDPLFWIICLSLLAIIWVHQRVTTAAAYKLGAKHGFAYGVDRAVNTLIDQNMVKDRDSQGHPITRSEVIATVMPLVLSQVVKDYKKGVDHANS